MDLLEHKIGQPSLSKCCNRSSPILHYGYGEYQWYECRYCETNSANSNPNILPGKNELEARIKFNYFVFIKDLPQRERDNKLRLTINEAWEPLITHLKTQPPPSIFADITI